MSPAIPTAGLRVLEPHPGVLAYHDGRVPGRRLFSGAPNWLDDGGYTLGIASYALLGADEALVYDTHLSLAHAEAIRRDLERRGARHFRVALSQRHLDHIAGNAAFADCEIIAHEATAEAMARHRADIEAGTHDGPPAISPLVMPNRTWSGTLALEVAGRRVELRHVDIHSRDGALLFVPDLNVLLAGDALEDTCTYVAEADGLERHLEELDRLERWGAGRLLPNHGAPDVIAAGGYAPSLIGATRSYVRKLIACRHDPDLRQLDLATFLADEIAEGSVRWFAPYEAVHRANVAAVVGGSA